MSGNSLLEVGTISEVLLTATGFELNFKNGNSAFPIPATEYPNTKFSLKTHKFFYMNL